MAHDKDNRGNQMKPIDYRIVNANTAFGRLVVKYFNADLPKGTYLEVDVPIDPATGEYVIGDALDDAIMERAPKYIFIRAAQVASTSNFELIERLVQEEENGDIAIPVDTLEELRLMAAQTLQKDLNSIVGALFSPIRYTLAEQYKYGLTELPGFIQVEADIRGISIEEVLEDLFAKRDSLRQVFSVLESKRIVAEHDLEDAMDAEELGYITYAYQLELKNVVKHVVYGKKN
jgi:hypothetical protein